MELRDRYFSVLSERREGEAEGVYRCRLLADCDCYRGHFPGHPVSPGVCNIGMIRECVALLLGRDVRLTAIKQCRLTAVASPEVCPEVEVKVACTVGETSSLVVASIADAERVYMELKGEVTFDGPDSQC